MEKLNCTTGNYQCGGKCQPNTNNCPNDIDKVDGEVISKYTTIIKKNAKNKSIVEYPVEFRDRLINLDEDLIFDTRRDIQTYIKDLRNEDEDFNRDYKNKDPRIKNGIIYYSLDGYHNINPLLRDTSNINNIPDEDLATLKIVLDDFNKLENYNGNNGDLHRGESPYINEELNIGDTYTNKGLLSTSTDINVAKMFEKGIMYRIIPKQYSNAKVLDYSNEKEVIYNHGQQFTVVDIYMDNNIKIIILKEI